MTHFPAMVFIILTTTKKSSPYISFILLGVIAFAGYFFFIKPQQRKAQAARANTSNPLQVGDEVQTIGGMIGTILEIHGDRYTLLTGHTEADGNLEGPQPTRVVFIRQAIAKKVERITDVPVDDGPPAAAGRGRGFGRGFGGVGGGRGDSSVVDDDDEDDHGGEEAKKA